MNANESNPIPPKKAITFLRWFCRFDLLEDVEGDLLEFFDMRVKLQGARKAKWLFILDILLLFRPGIIKPFYQYNRLNTNLMLKNHIKIAWRHLFKNKAYSLLNIGGLAMGMTVAILIGLWIWDELSFNKYHQNYDKIAQVMQNQTFGGEIQTWRGEAKQLAPALRSSYGKYFKHVTMSSYIRGYTLANDEKTITRSGVFMEAGAPEMLTLNMLTGTWTGLIDPYSILLSESTAKAFFGAKEPINKILKLDNNSELKVTGVYEDLPHNSTFANLGFIAPWELYEKGLPDWLEWGNSWFQTFVQIAENTNMDQISGIIKDVKLNNIDDDGERFKPELFLHPMPRWHLYSEFKQGVSVGGRIQYVWLFGIIGVFVLLLACINFMNLSTARSEKRAKEVGVRMAIGSGRSQLISQFFSESLLVAVLAFVVSLLWVQLILPFFNEVAGKEIAILWSNPLFWLLSIAFTLVTGIIAGSYPALYLSSFPAVKVLRGTFRVGRFAAIPRKVLVVVQFTVSVTLIIGTIIIFQQIMFAKNRPIGYNKDNLVSIPIKNKEITSHYGAFRHELLQTGAVEEVAKSESPITQTFTTNSGLDWSGKDPGMQDVFVTVRITHEFGKTVGWRIKDGRDFSTAIPSDSMGFVINEAAVEYLGFENPIGETLKWGDNGTYKIIGVVANMVTQSPYLPAKQTIFFIDYRRSNFANIKLNPNTDTSEAIAKIEEVFKKYDPANPFEYQFMDDDYARKFGNEERIGKLASFFAILAILISCLGLFGMASFIARQRTKEIGIRKVLGASVANLWRMLSSDFVVLVVLSCLISIPIAYYFLEGWLQQYEYRIEISYQAFVLAGVGALIITLLTVSYQAIKAAVANPINSLGTD